MASRLPTRSSTCDEEIDWDTILDSLSQCQSPEEKPSVDHQHSAQFSLDNSQVALQRGVSRRELPVRTSAIPSTTSTNAQTTASTTPTLSNPGLSTGAKAGIAGAVAIGVVIALATLVTLHTRRRRKKYGYTRTKGKDVMAAELEGHFVVTTWPDHGEGSPMMNTGYRRESDGHAVGFGLERLSGQHEYGRDTGSRFDAPESIRSTYPHPQYVVSPEIPQTERAYQSNIYSPTPQPYQPSPLLNNQPSPIQQDRESFEEHEQRVRPSHHPLSLLSEAMPPSSQQARELRSMADYQNAVPLGFANGFVQVGSRRASPETPVRTWDSIQPTVELDLGERFNHGRQSEEADAEQGLIQAAAAEEENVLLDEARSGDEDVIREVDGDAELPRYEEMPGMKKMNDGDGERTVKNRVVRESVRWDHATGHYHIDSESESEDEQQGPSSSGRRELTKEELG